ncbi:MFS allantoate transporter, putative [Beauveria bassiana ARSEF 2860]|uniref:MFS allantoate transporter, putative n=1 Tax=Beauveria bassiana (strain ARSEF 2860) TaxID=655819 RepID=J4UWF9_BEAB2|nr:MFS allantoate transporter, putative [Beauveria bassiana ARSEF 2860]EJP70652.1 MFS allantoate transporter, putative [Beauveria bassiana ARSEF 2860]
MGHNIEESEGNVTTIENLKVVADTDTHHLSPEEDRRIMRKLDLCLLPIMATSYFFQYLDKSALGSTAILGLRHDLGLSGSDYSWSSSIYYFGYIVASYPAGVVMIRWRVGKAITASILVWGSILMLTAVCHDAASLLATRFFLGVAESAIAPGLTIIISMFYKKSEQPLRHAAWFLGNTSAGLFGGLLNYGIGHMSSIAPWKASFLILGSITIAWSCANVFLLPDEPSNAWFFSKADREKVVIRVQENLTGIKNDELKWNQVREALLDPKTWFLVLIHFSSNIPNGGVTTFRSIILRGVGFSTFDTLLLQCVPYLVQLALVILCTGGSSYLKNTRTYWMMLTFATALVGAALVRQMPEENKWGQYAGTCLMGANSASFPLLMSMVSGNIGGFTKKTTVNALTFTAFCAGNIIGPQLFFEREAPSYSSGFVALIICQTACFILCLLMRFYLMWVNRSRHRHENSTELADEDIVQTQALMAMMDRTDKEIKGFRYVY